MAGERRVFYIGLNMSGAVSAGAYTAGVIDFLIDALDTLYQKRAEQRSKHGDNFAEWEIPAHEVRIVIMSGASAGGMVSAIASAALCENFTPVRAPMPAASPNRLYKSWVESIDIKYLLGNEDLKDPNAPVVSILDSTRIDTIAADATQINAPLRAKREYVADPLKVVLTLTNLNGIPYATEAEGGNDETQTLYHADQANFEVRWNGSSSAEGTLTLTSHSTQNWSALADAAKATGAFPIALAPRLLDRTTTIYNQRLWRISKAQPQRADGPCECAEYEKMLPNWKEPDGVSFKTINVDGGITNNNPFECAHQELARQEPAQKSGQNVRSANEADRAVISVAPFLSSPAFELNCDTSPGLMSIFGKLVDALVNQSRIQGENIKLTEDPGVYTRWAISPSIDDTTRSALASASISAFGGFFAKEFRDHDYQLGRRNCQWFLKQHFGVPVENVVVQDYPMSDAAKQRFVRTLADGSTFVPLIPLLDPLDPDTNPIPEARVKISQDRIPPIVDAFEDRLKLLVSRMFLSDSNFFKKAGFSAIWATAVEGQLKKALLAKIGHELGSQDLLA